jgi:hypothetical protein
MYNKLITKLQTRVDQLEPYHEIYLCYYHQHGRNHLMWEQLNVTKHVEACEALTVEYNDIELFPILKLVTYFNSWT